MAARQLDRAVAFAARHDKALAIAGGVWFWAGIAVYARFVALPELVPEAWRPWFFWLSVAFNAGWWGFLYPQIAARKKALADLAESGPPRGD